MQDVKMADQTVDKCHWFSVAFDTIDHNVSILVSRLGSAFTGVLEWFKLDGHRSEDRSDS